MSLTAIKMFIPSPEIWAAVGTMIGAAVIFAFTTQRSLGKMLTRKEHKEICDEKNQRIEETLTKIDETLGEHIRETREHRDRVANSLHTIGIKVAVIETKMRIPENERG